MTCEPWPVEWPNEAPTVSAANLTTATAAAQSILWGRTGRRLGLCTVTEEYRHRGTGTCWIPPRNPFEPRPYAGSCCLLRLRQTPVWDVSAVEVAGDAWDAALYAVEGDALRSRGGCWPVISECADPQIAVTYRHGIPLRTTDPLYALVAAAMGEVAREIAEGMGGGVCKLPSRAVTVTRNGVTVNMESTTDIAKNGLLGLPLADELIRLVNPHGLKAPSRVYSLD